MAALAATSAATGAVAATLTSRAVFGEAALLRETGDWWVLVAVAAADGALLVLGVRLGCWVAGSRTWLPATAISAKAALAAVLVGVATFPAALLVAGGLVSQQLMIPTVIAVPVVLGAGFGLALKALTGRWPVVGMILAGLCVWPCVVAMFFFFPIWYALVGALAGHQIGLLAVRSPAS